MICRRRFFKSLLSVLYIAGLYAMWTYGDVRVRVSDSYQITMKIQQVAEKHYGRQQKPKEQPAVSKSTKEAADVANKRNFYARLLEYLSR